MKPLTDRLKETVFFLYTNYTNSRELHERIHELPER